MKLLLDTHTIIWYVWDSPRLPRHIRQVIKDGANDIYVSVVSFWEISIKFRQEKLELGRSLVEIVRLLHDNGFWFLDIDLSHVFRLDTLEQHHKDPFDRMLIAQALAGNFALVGCDDVFDLYGVRRMW